MARTELTVIIPSYNMQKGALNAIDSILEQELDVKIIVVDDCSKPAIILPKPLLACPNIRLLRLPENSGPAHARNVGIQACKTIWVSFLDSDDIMLPDTLAQRFQFAKTHDQKTPDNGLHLYGCGWIEQRRTTSAWQGRTPLSATNSEQMASGCWYCPGSCIIAKKVIFATYPFDVNLWRLEDYDLGLRLGQVGVQLTVDQLIGARIIPSGSGNFETIHDSATHIKVKNKHLRQTNPSVWKRMIAYLEFEKSAACFRQSKYLLACKSLLLSIYYVPRLKRHFSPGWTYQKYPSLGR